MPRHERLDVNVDFDASLRRDPHIELRSKEELTRNPNLHESRKRLAEERLGTEATYVPGIGFIAVAGASSMSPSLNSDVELQAT